MLLGDHSVTVPHSTHKTSPNFSESSLEPMKELKFDNKFLIKKQKNPKTFGSP